MTKNAAKLARSVSLSYPPREPVTNTTPNPTRNVRWQTPSFRGKVARFVTTKLFINQVHSEIVHNYVCSCFYFFFLFLRITGLSYRIHKKEPKWLMVPLIVFNCIVFVLQVLYALLLMFHMQWQLHHHWTSVTHYSSLLVCVLSICLNIKVHMIRPQTIGESFSSSSLDERYLNKRSFTVKLLSLCSIGTIILLVVIVEAARLNVHDRFGIYSPNTGKMPFIFTCGTACFVFEAVLHGICTLILLTSTVFFLLFACAIAMEAASLVSDIKKYPSTQGLDHLIFRFQSIERSTAAMDRNYAAVIFAFISVSVAGIFFCLSKKAKLMISNGETGGVNALCTTAIFVTCTVCLVLFGVYLNNQLDEFRCASHKVSDLQQIDHVCTVSIKLLSFMLRLSGNTERIKVGGMFVLSRQSVVTLVLFFLLIGFYVFAMDAGCLNLF